MQLPPSYTAFIGDAQIATGPLEVILPAVKAKFDETVPPPLILIFDDQSGRQVDFHLDGPLAGVLERALPPRPGPGRPKLGVVSREVSLLPRHWDWLERQPNGASAALRRLVDQARKDQPDRQRMRLAIEATGRVMSALAGDRPGYEEALRALYAANRPKFEERIAPWPPDVRSHLQRLVQDGLPL